MSAAGERETGSVEKSGRLQEPGLSDAGAQGRVTAPGAAGERETGSVEKSGRERDSATGASPGAAPAPDAAAAPCERAEVFSPEGRERYGFGDLALLMERLRAPDGCPWDREQDHDSLKKYLIEETYEVLEAIDLKDSSLLCEELGDLLLQIVFHASISDAFGIGDVITGICKKMVSRHPHVFGGAAAAGSSAEVLVSWEAIKRGEKGVRDRSTVLKKVPSNLPALMRAYKVQQKAADAGFDWQPAVAEAEPAPALAVAPAPEPAPESAPECAPAPMPALAAAPATAPGESGGTGGAGGPNGPDRPDGQAPRPGRIREALALCGFGDASGDMSEAIGDLLFSAVSLSRSSKVHPELALTAATEKFIRRFEQMESLAGRDGRALEGLSPDEMRGYWEMAKGQAGAAQG
jgi:NTP pyrophosphatase (non-canonical NTP hydrolase)